MEGKVVKMFDKREKKENGNEKWKSLCFIQNLSRIIVS